MPDSELRVAVSIATRNRCEVLRETLAELMKLNPPPDEIVVHADACTDGTAEMIAERFPKVRLIESQQARGSVGGRDRILRETRADIVLSLDDDSYPMETDFVAKLRVLHAADSRAAVLSFPQVTDEYPETQQVNAIDRAAPRRAEGSYGGGACSYLRAAYLKLPGFVPEFFHTYEEPDYALQCVANGWRVVWQASLTIQHRYTTQNRNGHRTHSLHCRNEIWSVLLRCPLLLLPFMIVHRVLSQMVNAVRLGGFRWLMREPLWWWDAVTNSGFIWKRREPVSLRGYMHWLAICRKPEPLL